MFSRFDASVRQILIGNLLLVICCVFYLAWWLLAFKPNNPIKGTKSGWLLLPAFVFGIASVVMIARSSGDDNQLLLPNNGILIGGIVIYVALVVITNKLFNRQVTTELLLIVGWLVLVFREINILYSLGRYSTIGAIVLLIVSVILAVISLICYVMYYDLDVYKGYIDGMIPLIIVAVMMIVINLSFI
ncbi:MAG: hypothetical protein LUG12_10590 [Erysipelotrichaceae bacterium]|nr:hypothetical protein [Erysipelotrichaceae bacterium]